MNEVLDYIKQHISDLQQERETMSEYQDAPDFDYISGCIDSLEHVLAKFGAE